MSHHGDGIPPEMKGVSLEKVEELAKELSALALRAKLEKLGATGQHPEGKLTNDDEGEIRIAIGHTPGKVVMDFGDKPVKWIGFNPVQARQIAMALMEHADECLIIGP